MAESILDLFNCEAVTEMASGASALVSLSPEKVEEITKGDDDPRFATFVIESGWSTSKRYWPPEILDSIAEQVNGSSEPVVGYMGHIKPEDDGFSFPDIQVQWVKAALQPASDKFKLLLKGYVLPGTKGRDYITRKLVRTISVSGKANLERIKGGVKVSEFDLESIDLARPRRAGMATRLVALTSEMESEDQDVKPEEIAALSENEIRAHNPKLVETIEAEARKPLETKVTEMETAATGLEVNADMITKIREALGIDENADLLSVVGETVDKLKKAVKDKRAELFDEVLEKKFKNEHTRNLVKKLAVSEMETEGDDEDDDEDDEKYKERIEKRVTEMIENDADLKALASEHETGGGRVLTGGGKDRKEGESRKLEPGTETENISVSKAGGRR